MEQTTGVMEQTATGENKQVVKKQYPSLVIELIELEELIVPLNCSCSGSCDAPY